MSTRWLRGNISYFYSVVARHKSRSGKRLPQLVFSVILLGTSLKHLVVLPRIWVRGGVVGRSTALQAGRSWVRFTMGSFGFFIDLVLPDAL